MSKTVIKIENLSKIYRLGEVGTGTISHDLNRWWKMNILGQEDPFAKVGHVNDRTKKAEKGELVAALRDINLEVKEGEVLGIIGRNGAGKSTLLKILSRVTSPTTGSIKIKGRMASLLEVGTGFHPEMTGRENIYMNGTIMGMRRWEIDKQFDAIVDFAGIAKYVDTPVKRYSSGMTVRLGFAIAAHLEPEILVVDEVLAVGDAEFQNKAVGKMEDVSKNDGRTVLFVSHNMGTIQRLCKKGILLNQGIITHHDLINPVVNSYLNEGSQNDYSYVNTSQKKINFFTKVYTTDFKSERTNDFNFSENIRVKFEFEINEYIENLKVGIGLQDKNQNRVLTVLQPIGYFRTDLNSTKYKGSLMLPKSLIAPNSYSFVFAIWSKETTVYDSVENICSIKIHDDGTNLADYEGYNYGNVIVNVDWFND